MAKKILSAYEFTSPAQWEGSKQRAEQVRNLCREDLYFLCKYVLGYKDLGECHRQLLPLYNDVEKKKRTILILLPRGHFKSTVFTCGGTIQKILRNPDIRVGIGSWSMDLSQSFLGMIARQFMENTVLRKLFPDIIWENPKKEGSRWNRNQIELIRLGMSAEATVEAFSLESQPIGKHYDFIMCDDVVNAKNVATPEQIEKVKENYRFLTPILNKPSNPIHLVGTRYHMMDLYSELKEDNETFVIEEPAIDEDNNILFPERFTAQVLEDTRRRVGSWVYATQYLLKPIHPDDQKFDVDNLKTYKVSPKHESMEIYMGCDPGSSTKKGADPTTILVIGLDEDKNIYLLDGERRLMGVTEKLEKIISLGQKWKPHRSVIETIGAAQDFYDVLKTEMRRRGVSFPIENKSGYKRDERKNNRIQNTITPHMEAKRIFLPSSMLRRDERGRTIDLVQLITREFSDFPVASHDDLLDTMCLIFMSVPNFVPRAVLENRDVQTGVIRRDNPMRYGMRTAFQFCPR